MPGTNIEREITCTHVPTPHAPMSPHPMHPCPHTPCTHVPGHGKRSELLFESEAVGTAGQHRHGGEGGLGFGMVGRVWLIPVGVWLIPGGLPVLLTLFSVVTA